MTYSELQQMDKRTRTYKKALQLYNNEQAKLKESSDFLKNIFSLTTSEKKEILDSCDPCFLIYLHGNAATIPALKPIKERLNLSWRDFNNFCLKFCEIAR